jgi:hypothetical protein
MRTAVSAGRADSVAYTAPPIKTACSASDVAPTPTTFFFSVLRFVSSSLSSMCPPVSRVSAEATALRHKTRLDDEMFPWRVSRREPPPGPDRSLTRGSAAIELLKVLIAELE